MAMPARPYHHGNLRAVLLEHAERELAASGPSALSLRALARQAGVSHGAPHRHFADKQALLDALAEQGFERLGDELADAIARAGSDLESRFSAFTRAWVQFWVEH